MRRKYFTVELAFGKSHAKMSSASFPIESEWKSAAPPQAWLQKSVCVCVIQLNFAGVMNEAGYYGLVTLCAAKDALNMLHKE